MALNLGRARGANEQVRVRMLREGIGALRQAIDVAIVRVKENHAEKDAETRREREPADAFARATRASASRNVVWGKSYAVDAVGPRVASPSRAPYFSEAGPLHESAVGHASRRAPLRHCRKKDTACP